MLGGVSVYVYFLLLLACSGLNLCIEYVKKNQRIWGMSLVLNLFMGFIIIRKYKLQSLCIVKNVLSHMFLQILSFPVKRWNPCLFALKLCEPPTNMKYKMGYHVPSEAKIGNTRQSLLVSLRTLTCGARTFRSVRSARCPRKETTWRGPNTARRERGAQAAPTTWLHSPKTPARRTPSQVICGFLTHRNQKQWGIIVVVLNH